MNELRDMITPRGIEFSYSIAVIDWVTERGFTETMGARPMSRLINEQVKKPLAKQLLFGADITKVHLEIIDGELSIQTS